jgi:hypothetical protein
MASDAAIERELTTEWADLLASPVSPAAEMLARATAPRVSKPMLSAALEEVLFRFGELLPEASLRASEAITSLWTMKDLVAHMASWATEFVREVDIASRGEPFDYMIQFPMPVGPTAWNHREVERRGPRSFDDCARELAAGTLGLQQLALALPEDVLSRRTAFPLTPDGRAETRWQVRIADLVLMKTDHDLYHIGRIERWLRSGEY